jgi:uncharacterized protein (TIGR02118 family)
MTTKITFLYGNPTDPDAFEVAYAEQHLQLARAVPLVRRIEQAKVWPKEDGTPTPAWRILDLVFDDYAAACSAATSSEAGALFGAAFSIATGGLTILFTDVTETA